MRCLCFVDKGRLEDDQLAGVGADDVNGAPPSCQAEGRCLKRALL